MLSLAELVLGHLGAMSHAVRHQALIHGDTLQEGDVLVSNHPAAGGSHLPDLTVITPAFHRGKIIFWTAARAVSSHGSSLV